MNKFGWSYPPGCEGTPFDDPDPSENLPTVEEFCTHIGIEPLSTALRAIDRHNVEAVDILIEGSDEWIGPDDRRKLDTCAPNDPIARFRVRGIAWDGSDWEWAEYVDGETGLASLDAARSRFLEALDEHNAEMDAEPDPCDTPTPE